MGNEQGLIRPHSTKVALLWRLIDAIWIIVAYALACYLYPQAPETRDYLAATLAVIAFYLLGEPTGLYRPWRGAPLKSEVYRVWLCWSCVVPILLLAAFLSKTSAQYSRVITTTWFALAPAFISIWRASARFLLQELRARGRNTRAVAIVGATKLGESLARTIDRSPWLGIRLVGFYDDRDASRRHAIPEELGAVRGDYDKLLTEAKAGRIDTVYVTLPLRAEARVTELVRKFADTTCSVYVVPDFYVFDLVRARWSAVGDIPVVSIFESPFWGADGWLKRLEDVVLGSLILALIALPMLVISVGVRLGSRGPVFFRQRRYGLNGRPIEVMKFRTMSVCEDGPEIRQATKNDPRVTRFGAFLRRTSLDELPQFLQVVTGEMSIVGPRPHAIAHNEMYRKHLHGYMLRHKVKPGITGWAQVNGWRGETDTLEKMEKRVEHDLQYIGNWALSLDLKIIFLTVFGSSVRKNAY